MLCVTVTATGEIQAMSPQPDKYTECALVIQPGAHIASNPFVMTREEGIQIGVAIGTIWVVVGTIMRVSRRI